MKTKPNPSGRCSRNKRYLSPFTFKSTIFPPDFVLKIDTREQQSPLFLSKPPKGLMVVRDTLHNGDYGIKGFDNFCIEKKYAGDLFPYCSSEMVAKTIPKMERFREIIDKGGWVGLVIEDTMSNIYKYQEYTNIHPESVRGALVSFAIRYGVHVHFAGNRVNTAQWILDHAVKWYNVQKEL